MTAEQYATHWQENSTFFSDGGYYNCMADSLESPSTVIEIGCGSGSGTLAIASIAKRVISIEVNATLANIAAAYLIANGIKVQVAEIETVKNLLTTSNHYQVIIVIADVFDHRINELLPSDEVDAIACWLIGAHPGLIAKHAEKNLESFTGQEMPEYRVKVHERCYDLGLSLLKVGGIVHITDRVAINHWNDKDKTRLDLMNHHNDLSNGKYKILKENTFLKRIEKSFTTSKIQYILAAEASNCTVTAISSIASIKI